MKTMLPKNEAERLQALYNYKILDTEPEAEFDALTSLAAYICSTPIALVSLLDIDRQWFKSKVGLTVQQTGREMAFCDQTICQNDLLVVRDSLADERFATNPLVTSAPHIRFYAGAPLITPEGLAIGSLCVIDYIPRDLNTEQIEALKVLSQQVMTQLELRRKLVEYRKSEEALRKAAAENLRLAQAVASVSDGVLITDPNQPDNPVIYANPAFSQLTGYQPEEIIGCNCRFLQGVDTDKQAIAQISQAIAEHREVQTTLINYRKDGQPFWNEVKISPVLSDQGELMYFVGIQTDISDRQRAEAALKQSESTLRSFFDSASMMMGIVEVVEDDILHISDNTATAKFFGLTPAAMQNRLASEMGVPKIYIREWIEHYHEAERTRSPVRFVYPHDTRWLSVTVSFIAVSSSRYSRFAYVVEDITQQKQAAQKIRQQAALLNVTTDAILVRDLNNQILFWNKGAEQLYGWQAEEAVGKNAIALLYKEQQPQLKAALKTIALTSEWRGELCNLTKFGKEIIVESRWTLVCDETGQPKSILSVDTDITEKKQLERQFLRTQRLESIGTLAGGIAHDLNNVLAPILMSAQLLQMKISDEKSQKLLKTVETNAKRGAALLKQLLSFARGVEGKHTILQVKHLIAEIKQIAKETFPKSIGVYTDIPQNLWAVSGDATQLHQVLMNLCVNARDAMPDGGTLRISAENLIIEPEFARLNLEAKVGAYIAIAVTDSGTGIAPEIVDRIFEPFFTTKELGKGTGLGLSTVMGIIKSHGGFIHVSSELGKGTEFKVYLPAYLPAVEASQLQPAPEVEATPGNGELILVVDDEAAIRETTKASLEAYNYKVLTANDGTDAVAAYVQHRQQISMVLIDMMMPMMDGPTTIRTLQKLNPELKIIAVSGIALADKLAAATGNGVKAFLSKPYTAPELLTTINQLL